MFPFIFPEKYHGVDQIADKQNGAVKPVKGQCKQEK
jgi:hypothetical protein